MTTEYMKINIEVPQYSNKEQYEMYIRSRKEDIKLVKELIQIAKKRIKLIKNYERTKINN